MRLLRLRNCASSRAPACEAPRCASLRTRGRRKQDVVVLGEDPILLGAVLVALVARDDGAFRYLNLEGVLVAEAEVGPEAGVVLEALRDLDRDRQPPEVA